METNLTSNLTFGSASLQLVQPISTASGRKFSEALPTLTRESHGIFMAVGYPHDFIVYRASVSAEGTSWSFTCFGPTSI